MMIMNKLLFVRAFWLVCVTLSCAALQVTKPGRPLRRALKTPHRGRLIRNEEQKADVRVIRHDTLLASLTLVVKVPMSHRDAGAKV